MKKAMFILALLALFGMAKPAMAQDETPKAEAFLGYSYVRANAGGSSFNFNGGSGQLEYNANNWLGIVGDFGGYKATIVGTDVTLFSYLFGPRINFRGHGKVNPFAQVLFGGARLSGGGPSLNDFAMTAGGGLDFQVSEHIAIRPVQAEYFLTKFPISSNNRQNNFRYSAGIVFRFGGSR